MGKGLGEDSRDADERKRQRVKEMKEEKNKRSKIKRTRAEQEAAGEQQPPAKVFKGTSRLL